MHSLSFYTCTALVTWGLKASETKRNQAMRAQRSVASKACGVHAGDAAVWLPAQGCGCSPRPDLAELCGLPASQVPCLQSCMCAPLVLQHHVQVSAYPNIV